MRDFGGHLLHLQRLGESDMYIVAQQVTFVATPAGVNHRTATLKEECG